MTRRRVPRTRLVCHRVSTARRNALRLAASSSGVNWTRSRSSSSRAISISRSIELLRRTSVGCAVRTGLQSAWAKNACSWSARNAGAAGAIERVGHRALPRRRLGHRVGTGAADVVLVLGEVGEMGEIAERPDDTQRLPRRQAAHDGLQFLPGGLVGVAMELHAGAPYVFDQLEHRIALLGPHRVAQDAPEQPYVVAQRQVLVGRFAVVQGFHRLHHNTTRGPGFDIRVEALRWHTNCMKSGQFA